MISKQEIQDCLAFLELARMAIENAEMYIVNAPDDERSPLRLTQAAAQISAGAHNMRTCADRVTEIAKRTVEESNNAAAPV